MEFGGWVSYGSSDVWWLLIRIELETCCEAGLFLLAGIWVYRDLLNLLKRAKVGSGFRLATHNVKVRGDRWSNGTY